MFNVMIETLQVTEVPVKSKDSDMALMQRKNVRILITYGLTEYFLLIMLEIRRKCSARSSYFSYSMTSPLNRKSKD